MCALLISMSVGGYFTWMLFLFVCFLSSWPLPVSVSLPFKASCLCMLARRKIHIRALWNGLKTRHRAGRCVVIVFPETSYTSCTHPMTSLAVPTKMKLPVLSTWLPHWCEGWYRHCLPFWRRLCIFSVQLHLHLQLDSSAGPMQGLMWLCSPYSVCISKHCGQLWSCSLPQVALQDMQAHFYLSIFCSLQLNPPGFPCGSERCWNIGGSPVVIPCLVPVSHLASDLTFWPSFFRNVF